MSKANNNRLLLSVLLIPGVVISGKIIAVLYAAKKTADMVKYGGKVAGAIKEVDKNLNEAKSSQIIAKSNNQKIVDRVDACRSRARNLDKGEFVPANTNILFCEAVFNSKTINNQSKVQSIVLKQYTKAKKQLASENISKFKFWTN